MHFGGKELRMLDTGAGAEAAGRHCGSCVILQVIANTAGVLGVGGTPHEVLPRAGKSIVDVDKVPFKGPKTPQAKWHKVRHHQCPHPWFQGN
jgi:hypothetical protein